MAHEREGPTRGRTHGRLTVVVAYKPAAIVADLGRPETPEETAARKAANSRRHRANQTLFNLVVALVATLGIVLVLVTVVVRPTPEPAPSIDYAGIAAQAQPIAEAPLVVPVLPETWVANAARFQTRSQVPTWYVGFITPSTQFIAFNQGINANPTWQDAVLSSAQRTGEITIDSVVWTLYDRRDVADPGNFAYSIATTVGASTFVLHGTGSDVEFEALATSVTAELRT